MLMEGFSSPVLLHESDSSADPARDLWRVRAVGKRPIDHIARDILHQAILRDYRTSWFRDLVATPPDWMGGLIPRRLDRFRTQAVENLALQMMHAQHLDRLVSESPVLDSPQEAVLASMRRCPPYGILVQPRREWVSRHWHPCRLARVCPWCHGRKAIKLFKQIQRSVQSPAPGNRYLVLVTTSGSSESLPDLRACRPDYMTLYHHINIVHEKWRRHLLQLATRAGFAGGMLFFAMSPWRVGRDVMYRLHSPGAAVPVRRDSRGVPDRAAAAYR